METPELLVQDTMLCIKKYVFLQTENIISFKMFSVISLALSQKAEISVLSEDKYETY